MAKDFGYGSWEVTCPTCGNTRTLRAHKYLNGEIRGSKTSCWPCRAIKLHRRIDVKCPTCGIVRTLRRSYATQRLSSFCQSCVKRKPGVQKRLYGVRHAGKTSCGYVMVYGMSGHPLAKNSTVLEHWLVVYEHHPMGPDSVLWLRERSFTIHHKNGVRDDNRLDNLEFRAPGRHPHGWTISEMEEVVHRFRNRT